MVIKIIIIGRRRRRQAGGGGRGGERGRMREGEGRGWGRGANILIFMEPLSYAKHYASYFSWIILYNNYLKLVQLLSPPI